MSRNNRWRSDTDTQIPIRSLGTGAAAAAGAALASLVIVGVAGVALGGGYGIIADWRVGFWYWYSAQFVPIEESSFFYRLPADAKPRFEMSVPADLVAAGGTKLRWLYFVVPVVLSVAGGALVRRLDGEDAPDHEPVVDESPHTVGAFVSFVVVYFLLFAIAGTGLATVSLFGNAFVPDQSRALVFGVVYPLVFGGAGALIARVWLQD